MIIIMEKFYIFYTRYFISNKNYFIGVLTSKSTPQCFEKLSILSLVRALTILYFVNGASFD